MTCAQHGVHVHAFAELLLGGLLHRLALVLGQQLPELLGQPLLLHKLAKRLGIVKFFWVLVPGLQPRPDLLASACGDVA